MKKDIAININEIKYAYFDMDGTFLTSKKIPSPRTLETLDKLKKIGINCSIATGRPYFFAQNEIKTINPQLPVISCNGALVFDPTKKELISYSSIEKKDSKRIFDILVKNDAIFLVYTTNKMFKFRNLEKNPESKWFTWIDENNKKFVESERADIVEIFDHKSFDIEEYDIIKFLIIYSEMPLEKYKVVESEVSTIQSVYIVKSQNEVFDIMPHGLSKGEGLKKLHEQKIIDLNRTIVFGDAENDLSMFEAARWSVAMGNAQEKTKDKAMFITDDNNNDGIAKFFDLLFNKNN